MMKFPECLLDLVKFRRNMLVCLMVAFGVVCHGLQETVPANVTLRHHKGGNLTKLKSTMESVDLLVSIHTPFASFRFRLTPILDRHNGVPVFFQGNTATFRTPNSTKSDIKLYKDIRKRAWFNFHPGTNKSHSWVAGIFSSRGFLYTLRRNSSEKGTRGYILIYKEAILPTYYVKPRHSHTVIEELPDIESPFRNIDKRQVVLYEIELFLAIDYSVFKVWVQDNRNLSTTDYSILEDIRAHYILMVHSINSRFETIMGNNYAVEVCLVGIYVANSSATNPWLYTTRYLQNNSDRPILPSDAMSLFANWVKLQRDYLPNFDHAMAFTADNLAHKENLKTLGVASQQSMCTERSLSIIEDHGNIAYASFVATHELAHSLGAKHDGQPPTVKYKNRIETCRENEDYIMSPKTTSAPKTDDNDRSWKFSQCSLLYFDFYIDHLNSVNNNCLLHSDLHNMIVAQTTAYSPDEQCTRINGEGSVLDRDIAIKNPHDICRSIPCTQPRDITVDSDWLNILSMEGTVCDIGMVCQRGRCVRTSENSAESYISFMSEKCIFGDQPGKIHSTQMSCLELIQENPHNCYRYKNVCCSSCRKHLRHQAIVVNCSYGDHLADCDWTMCNSTECCETCAVLNGVYAPCPDIEHHAFLQSSTNTMSYHYGTVITFSCWSGYIVDGSETITCMQDGTWSGQAPTCYRGCAKFQETSARSVNLSNGNYSFGTLAHFRCLHGLSLIGDGTALCMNTSRWNTSAPSCTLKFSSPDSISIAENSRGGTIVHCLSTGHAQSEFEMTAMSQPGFKVDQSGKVTIEVSMEIDYERTQLYRLYIRATLAADLRFKASQVLQIKVKDINEYAPVFERSIYSVSLSDDISLGNTLVQIRAHDRDLSTSKLTYSIAESDFNNNGNLFGINSTSGVIFLKSKSSYIAPFKDDTYLTIHAVDDGLPEPKSGSTLLKICVDTVCSACPDIEHHAFLQSSTNTMSYHYGTVITFSCWSGYIVDGSETITCMQDGTWSGQAPTCYRGCAKFQETSARSVNLSNGNYSFGTLAHFRCLHGLSLIGDGTALCMNTSRWNTSAPSCTLKFSSPDSISIAENSRGGTIVHCLSTGHAQSEFEMTAMSQPGFKVDQSGKVTIEVSMEIDYERTQLYRLYIRATLAADLRFKASQVLQIKVKDINEYAPVFERSIYSVSLSDDISLGNTLVQIRAHDRDLSTSKLTYSIAESDFNNNGNLFGINSTSGVIFLKSKSSYIAPFKDDTYLTIHAVDDGLPEPKSGSTLLKICVDTVCSGKSTISLDLSLFLTLIIHLPV